MDEIPKRFWDDLYWLDENFSELRAKYKEKWVAIVDKKVVCVGDDPSEIEKEAEKKTGNRYVLVDFVESGDNIY